jgi:hypothetical protein
VSSEETDGFLGHLMKSREDWQVSQTNEAIRLYIYYKRSKCRGKANADIDSDTQWMGVVQEMVRMLRLKHCSLSTEKSYIGWLRSFYRFLNGQSPKVTGVQLPGALERKFPNAGKEWAWRSVLDVHGKAFLPLPIQDVGLDPGLFL